ncbi:LysR family transcriptional regulator [Paraburkholderia ferrariae]|uniref:LysR family transcriptional regulator n=1 Tax=Paraburkholderia ferrariae TaxID=386056 RepID=UPI00146FDDF8|nr:LysR family transcriptional regulator [Paraburkholderia ferrariae]
MTPFRQRLKLRHISVVIEVARQGSLQKAADLLMVSQSAVSKALAEVESIVNCQLFDRTPSGVRPTAMGHALVRHGHLILGDVLRAEAEIDALQSGEAGNLSVGVFTPLSWWGNLATCVTLFRAQCPRIRLSVQEDSMEILLQRLEQDLVDIVIGRPAGNYGSESYEMETLCEDRPLFVAREGHRLVQGPVELGDLLGFPWILPAPPNVVRQQLELAVQDAGMRQTSEIISAQLSNMMLRLASQSDTLILVPQCILREVHDTYRLCPVRCSLPLPLSALVAIVRRDKPRGATVATFLSKLKSELYGRSSEPV